jgi:hypothetical protein
MESLPCEVFMNEAKIETNLMEKENPNPKKCCPRR